jgi:hypothetical protein
MMANTKASSSKADDKKSGGKGQASSTDKGGKSGAKSGGKSK